jgi:hypothetical protein
MFISRVRRNFSDCVALVWPSAQVTSYNPPTAFQMMMIFLSHAACDFAPLLEAWDQDLAGICRAFYSITCKALLPRDPGF